MWTLRRSEDDVVNLYNYLSGIMQISTSGNFLNFGYWDDTTHTPLEAQTNLCDIVGNIAELSKASQILDVGSGFSEPAIRWEQSNPNLNIICLNINSDQLRFANKRLGENNQKMHHRINLLNSTALMIPLLDESCDRIIALESAQHFRPINEFISETKRVLKKDGLSIIAIPVLAKPSKMNIFRIGILKFTWSSEHYDLDIIKKIIQDAGLIIKETRMIGLNVYAPLVDYYIRNHSVLRSKILKTYPSYVEKILFRSMLKMKEAAKNETIEYVLVKYGK